MITLVSASYGAYDNPNPLPELEGVASTMVTDSEEFARKAQDAGWEHVTIQPIPHAHPRLAAKVPKCDPMRFVFTKTTETYVWLDAAARITNGEKFVQAVESIPRHEPIGQFDHPDRDDVIDEAKVSKQLLKYDLQEVETQAGLYVRMGLPRHWGLWATGMIVYHPAAFDMPAFGNAWLAEQLAWTYQDQISEPYLLWLAGYRPKSLPGNLRDNGYVTWMPHVRDD